MTCYCRGAAICPQGHHKCTDCTCDDIEQTKDSE